MNRSDLRSIPLRGLQPVHLRPSRREQSSARQHGINDPSRARAVRPTHVRSARPAEARSNRRHTRQARNPATNEPETAHSSYERMNNPLPQPRQAQSLHTGLSNLGLVEDEWLKTYGGSAKVPAYFLDSMVDLWRSQGFTIRDFQNVLSDIDTLFSTPNQSHKTDLRTLIQGHDAPMNQFMRASPGQLSQVYPVNPLPLDDIAWVDHRVWLDGHEDSLTLPSQPHQLLNVANFQSALRVKGCENPFGNCKYLF